ncbi:sialidase family protein, partial [Marinitenerispora sediminis]
MPDPATSSAPDALPTDGVLRPRAGDPGRADAYLPAPAVQNHAANLAELPGGDLGCVWFGGTQEGVSDIGVWFSRLPRGADTWTEPVALSDDRTRSEQNPVLFAPPSGGLWLLWTAQRAGHQDTSEVRRRISADGGRTWGAVETLFPARPTSGVFIRQPVTVLDSGRWLLPVFHCVSVPGRAWVGDRDTSAVMVSDDQGATWRERPVPDSTGCVHMNIQALADGTLLALFRSRWADHVHRSHSTDGGETWSAPVPTALPNNNSSIQFVRLRDDRLALVYNASSAADATERRVSLYDEIDDDGLAPSTPGAGAPAPEAPTGAGEPGREGERTAFWGAPRAPMTLAVSADGGATWPLRHDLEVGDGYCLTNNSRDGLNREFSYPSILQNADGGLDVAFTYYRQAIKHVRLSPEWLAARAAEA